VATLHAPGKVFSIRHRRKHLLELLQDTKSRDGQIIQFTRIICA
jgi:hypothetical protein